MTTHVTEQEQIASCAPGVSRRKGSTERPLAIFVLIDALGWCYLEGKDFLQDTLPYRRSLRTVLGFSSGAIPTILTGTSPTEHGHWNLFYYDPKGSPFKWVRYLHFLSDSILDSRVSRKLIKETGRRFLGLGPLFECCVTPRLLHYFNWVERRNIYGNKGITGAPSIFDRLTERGVSHRVYTYHDATDAEILKQAERDITHSDASFFFVYLSEMEMFLHMNCNSPEKIGERLRWYDEGLRKLLSAALAVDPEVSFTVTSDHGMTPVREHYDLLKDITDLNLKMPEDYLAVYDSTMARFWFFNDRARQRVMGLLNGLSCGHVLSDAELQAFGVLFADSRFGETIFLLRPGTLFSRSDFNGKGWSPSGMHGYHPGQDRYSDAIFLSNRVPNREVETIRDVYDCMWQAAQEVE